MLIVRLHAMRLRARGDTEVTLAQRDFDTGLQSAAMGHWDGNIQAVVSNTVDEGASRVAEQLRLYYGQKLDWVHLTPEDLLFDVCHYEIVDGLVWLAQRAHNCKTYKASFRLTGK